MLWPPSPAVLVARLSWSPSCYHTTMEEAAAALSTPPPRLPPQTPPSAPPLPPLALHPSTLANLAARLSPSPSSPASHAPPTPRTPTRDRSLCAPSTAATRSRRCPSSLSIGCTANPSWAPLSTSCLSRGCCACCSRCDGGRPGGALAPGPCHARRPADGEAPVCTDAHTMTKHHLRPASDRDPQPCACTLACVYASNARHACQGFIRRDACEHVLHCVALSIALHGCLRCKRSPGFCRLGGLMAPLCATGHLFGTTANAARAGMCLPSCTLAKHECARRCYPGLCKFAVCWRASDHHHVPFLLVSAQCLFVLCPPHGKKLACSRGPKFAAKPATQHTPGTHITCEPLLDRPRKVHERGHNSTTALPSGACMPT